MITHRSICIAHAHMHTQTQTCTICMRQDYKSGRLHQHSAAGSLASDQRSSPQSLIQAIGWAAKIKGGNLPRRRPCALCLIKANRSPMFFSSEDRLVANFFCQFLISSWRFELRRPVGQPDRLRVGCTHKEAQDLQDSCEESESTVKVAVKKIYLILLFNFL